MKKTVGFDGLSGFAFAASVVAEKTAWAWAASTSSLGNHMIQLVVQQTNRWEKKKES